MFLIMRLMKFKPSLKKGLEDEVVNAKVNYLSFFFHATKLVIFLLDALIEKIQMKRRKASIKEEETRETTEGPRMIKMKERKVSTKEEDMKKTKREARMKKVRKLVILLKKRLIMNMRVMMMKLFMFL